MCERITNKALSLIEHYKTILNKIKSSNVLINPINIYNIKKDILKMNIKNLNKSIDNIITFGKMQLFRLSNSYVLTNPKVIYENKKIKLENNINKLELLNPLSALKRGYAIVKKDNKCIQSIKQLKKDDKINLYISNGDIEALITNVKEEK